MRGLKYLFTVPEGEKVTEKHLTRVLVSSVCSILLCMSCLISTSWAWFTVSIENTGNVITVGEFAINSTVTDINSNYTLQPTSLYEHSYYLPEGQYSVQLSLKEGSVAGYCEIYINSERVGTLTLDQATYSLRQQGTELLITVHEATPVMNMMNSDSQEPLPNLVIVPTWGTTSPEDMLVDNQFEIGEKRNDRLFAVSMNNAQGAMPFYGINEADLFFELLIDRDAAVTRGLAIFSELEHIEKIGSVRSVRYNLTDLAQAYGAILVHADGSDKVIEDLNNSGVENLNAIGYLGFRDPDHSEISENTLFVNGDTLVTEAKNKNWYETEQKETGLIYAAEGNTAGGETADQIEISFDYQGVKKTTTMVYNNGKYDFYQFGKLMYDEYSDQDVAFTNVMVLQAETKVDEDGYYVATLTGEGTGYFAYGGNIVEIKWSRVNDKDPFTFTLTDGTPVVLGEGNTYVAIVPAGSPVTFQ